MKKLFILVVIVIAAMGFAWYNQHQEVVKEKPPVTEPNGENPSEPNKPEEPVTHEPEDPVTHEPEKNVYQNEVFKDVVVKETTDTIIITGKAQVFEGVFQYALYDGDKVVKESNYQTAGAPAWGDFEITFDKALVSSNPLTLQLFVYSAKDGSKINTLEIPIPK
ncbi:Gmad2 immunoglobulin-like domain-containing protein [Bacillus sp. sid0103]|uniref:Gmad2 immunoglobulin-like domain-containing protein n=1 Tax=Bacillus sp. sid0103 TaxID=2856337 RepID=UPI001C46ED47|nr:Gmad2 immunoglobulin-like domain-containing protein [Bacillus sp. sid0103]MBV7508676.1 Gmad2 immunoglobulin-like domain-containing protein [Bacillus sp. sid0103]